jgi:hypothetical protein
MISLTYRSSIIVIVPSEVHPLKTDGPFTPRSLADPFERRRLSRNDLQYLAYDLAFLNNAGLSDGTPHIGIFFDRMEGV